MSEWVKASANEPTITELFDTATGSNGSVREQAFDELRARLTAADTPASGSYDTQFAELADLDMESTQFEVGLRNLRDQVVADLAADATGGRTSNADRTQRPHAG